MTEHTEKHTKWAPLRLQPDDVMTLQVLINGTAVRVWRVSPRTVGWDVPAIVRDFQTHFEMVPEQ